MALLLSVEALVKKYNYPHLLPIPIISPSSKAFYFLLPHITHYTPAPAPTTMHFLIATAALLSAATLATANPFIRVSIGLPPPKVTCRINIVNDGYVIVRDCPSRDCDVSQSTLLSFPPVLWNRTLIPHIGDDEILRWRRGGLLLLFHRHGGQQSGCRNHQRVRLSCP